MNSPREFRIRNDLKGPFNGWDSWLERAGEEFVRAVERYLALYMEMERRYPS